MSNRAQQSIDDGSMTAVWAVVDNGCLETPLDNGAVVRQKGGLVTGQERLVERRSVRASDFG